MKLENAIRFLSTWAKQEKILGIYEQKWFCEYVKKGPVFSSL